MFSAFWWPQVKETQQQYAKDTVRLFEYSDVVFHLLPSTIIDSVETPVNVRNTKMRYFGWIVF